MFQWRIKQKNVHVCVQAKCVQINASKLQSDLFFLLMENDVNNMNEYECVLNFFCLSCSTFCRFFFLPLRNALAFTMMRNNQRLNPSLTWQILLEWFLILAFCSFVCLFVYFDWISIIGNSVHQDIFHGCLFSSKLYCHQFYSIEKSTMCKAMVKLSSVFFLVIYDVMPYAGDTHTHTHTPSFMWRPKYWRFQRSSEKRFFFNFHNCQHCTLYVEHLRPMT